MSDWSDCYDEARGAVILRVHVQPRAARTGVVGRHGDALKLRVTAPPLDDRANSDVEALIARVVGVAPSAVTIVGGARSRAKRVRIEGIDGSRLAAALARSLGGAAPGR